MRIRELTFYNFLGVSCSRKPIHFICPYIFHLEIFINKSHSFVERSVAKGYGDDASAWHAVRTRILHALSLSSSSVRFRQFHFAFYDSIGLERSRCRCA